MSAGIPTDKPDLTDQLHDIVDRMLAPHGKKSPRGRTVLAAGDNPFEISRPNEHDSRADFKREYDAVVGAIENISHLMSLLLPAEDDEDGGKMMDRLSPIINHKMRSNSRRLQPDSSMNLVRRNVGDVGGYTATMWALVDFRAALRDRAQELEDQKSKFWNLPHRAPDHYARAIALRLARLFAEQTGQYPTYGTSGITGEASTSYTRALREVFVLLEIKPSERTYAEWAVSQLTDDDLKPASNALLRAMMAGPLPGLGDGILGALARDLDKKPAGE